jgi:hypothetical protein
MDGPVTLVAHGRDLHTATDGAARVLDAARVDARAELASGELLAISADPPRPKLERLVGRSVHRGFRQAVRDTIPDEATSGSVRFQLLDDLPIVLLLSLRVPRAEGIGPARDPGRLLPVDVCAGFAAGGEALSSFGPLGPPLHVGPIAVPIEPADDPTAWHAHEALPAHSTRRRRRIDVWFDDGVARVDSIFRDSHMDGAGVETVVHQYAVRAAVDPSTMRLVTCEAAPGPLPYDECPTAAASSHRLVGQPVDHLRRSVLDELTGPTTCTHLNDAVRALEDVGALLSAIVQPQ